MKPPTISQARALCDILKARGVIILAFEHGDVSGASYGETRLECRQTGKTLDCIIEDIANGRIPVWGNDKQ